MKFARYLEETLTPEWQKAYIDYRLLKKRISAIRAAMGGTQNVTESPISTRMSANAAVTSEVSATQSLRPPNSAPSLISASTNHILEADREVVHASLPELARSNSPVSESQSPRREAFPRSTTLPASLSSGQGRAPSFSRLFSSSNSRTVSRRLTQLVGPKPHPYSELPLRELLPLLSPTELAFFTTLDGELKKIEEFYVAREHDMKLLTDLLEQQLNELDEHRKRFEAAYSSTAWSSALKTNAFLKLKSKLINDEEQVEETVASSAAKAKGKYVSKRDGKLPDTAASSTSNLSNATSGGFGFEPQSSTQLDPNDFLDAKHKLRKAVMEHYRGLEMLQNYRILNLTGIRKALKKFQKVTKIPAQKAYISEKVEKTQFAYDENVRAMMDKMEVLYTARFTHGDKKKALGHLRLGPLHKTHHVSTFWSGLLVGLAIPALASGLYHSYQQDTRNSIPGWDALLLVYGVFFIPVLFSWLVGLNILVWSRARINYVFIFEFDLRTRMDHRDYIQLPSILLAALCYAFWLSFSQIGAPSISPTTWPLVWLGFAGVIMLDPLPFMFKPSRFWLLKSIGKLLTSGTRPVEFADFWMGDQLCSLVFTLSNIYLVACLYDEGYNSNWRKCGAKSRLWPLSFVLAILPFLVRLVQSVKRYVDSGLDTHLINAGKYGSGVVAYLCYFVWRHRGGFGPTFVVWCIFQTLYSFYAMTWDLTMDWSILSFHGKYPLLRKNLVYADYIYLYYFAIVSNFLIRFIWVLYIPTQGPDIVLRTFIAAFCEMMRRWQWNFLRLENEQLGNIDQYRATREVPLPYTLEDRRGEGDDDERSPSPTPKWLPQRGMSLRRQRGAVEV